MLMIGNAPRRIQVDQLTPVEALIREAIIEVEKLDAHELLTDAVILLQRVQDKIADYVELE